MDDIAPWVAIAVTLIISILIPLFTQIANNCFTLKMKEKEREDLLYQEKVKVYDDFLSKLGTSVENGSVQTYQEALASATRLYLYIPAELQFQLGTIITSLVNDEENTLKQALVTFSVELAKDLHNMPNDKVSSHSASKKWRKGKESKKNQDQVDQ